MVCQTINYIEGCRIHTIKGNNKTYIMEVKETMQSHFKLQDLGELKYFIGIEVARSKTSIYPSQRKYTLELLEEFGHLGSRPSKTPIEQNLKLTKADQEPLADATRNRRLVGRLLYLIVTRPNITYSSKSLANFLTSLDNLIMQLPL